MRRFAGIVLILLLGCSGQQRKAGHVHVVGAPDDSGVEVIDTFSGEGAGIKHIITGPDGSFDFDGDLPGAISAFNDWTVEGKTSWADGRSGDIPSYPDLTMRAAGDVLGVATLGGQFDGDAGIIVSIDGVPKTTDEFGDFYFDKLAVGAYEVSVFAVGYHVFTTTVAVSYGKVTVIPDINLEAD